MKYSKTKEELAAMSKDEFIIGFNKMFEDTPRYKLRFFYNFMSAMLDRDAEESEVQ